MKKFGLVALAVLSLFWMTACNQGRKEEVKEEKSEARVIVDHYGKEVTLPDKIEKVAILELLPLPSVLAVYQGGNVDNLVVMPPDSLNAAENSILAEYAPGILKVSTDAYKNGTINLEELMNLDPDIIFYSGEENAEKLKETGIPAVGFSPTAGGVSPLATTEKWLEQFEEIFQAKSKVTGIVEYGKETEAEIKKRIAAIPENERVDVMQIAHYNEGTLTVAGKGTFGEYWVDITGGNNVALSAKKNAVNMEQVYEWQPKKIFLSTLTSVMPEDLYNNTAIEGHDWSTVEAVQNKEVYKFPLGIHRWWPPSTDAPLTLWWLAKNTYPEQFKDIDLEEKMTDYYKEFYGLELTKEQVKQILNPQSNVGRLAFQ
ncbi:ABC transporter substrate-binding protein [Erwinia sp. CPCC 100877]|nr:ABC transporter substrate-binding protein [Erwinia sp. CPCC 100877]